ncbi:MAG: hypothetical protein ACI8UC_000532 [Psychromonas sp.]
MITPHPTIYDDPAIRKLLVRMPNAVADSFNEEQLSHLLTAIGAKSWGKHAVDVRGTFKIPFYRWRFYYVLLLGKYHRGLSRKEMQLSLPTSILMFSLFLILCSLGGLLLIYFIKTALGIDLFSGFSLEIWMWFEGLRA